VHVLNPVRDDFGKDVSGDGIHAEYAKWHGPASTPALDVEHPITDRETNQRHSGGEDHERTGPQLLIDGKPDVEEFSNRQSGRSKHGQTHRLSPCAAL